jgi:uncharacterized membrane protein YdjX (TVP38/TMEM64 family)
MENFLSALLGNYPLIAPFLFIIIRALAIIIPPIPGIVIDLAGLLSFGWSLGFIYAETGIMFGATAAFLVARVFREPLLNRFLFLQKLYEWERKLSEKQKFWALVAIRLPTNPLFDIISYAAGLTTISTAKFFLSTLIGNAPSVFLIFYFGGLSFQKGPYYAITFFVALLILWLIFRKSKNG